MSSQKKYFKLWFYVSAHSMEEAEVLCDRLGIFVDGSLQCIGNPKEVILKHILYLNSWKQSNNRIND